VKNEIKVRALGVIKAVLAEAVPTGMTDAALLDLPLEDLAIDSLSKLELVLELEKTFGLLLDETRIAACRSLGDLVSLVAEGASK
jgi:acyl carrier protein